MICQTSCLILNFKDIDQGQDVVNMFKFPDSNSMITACRHGDRTAGRI